MKHIARIASVALALLIFLPVLTARDVSPPSDEATHTGDPTPTTPKEVKLPPPRMTFKCVQYYNATSKTSLPTNNAMMSFMDKDGNLYVALRSEATHEGKKISGGLFVITAKGKSYLYNRNSRPPIPTDSVEHALKDEKGLIYVATGTNGLAVIDTKATPEDQSDDTVIVYTMMGATDVTKKLDAEPSSHSPAIGCDHVTFSWMDPETRDLLICAGGQDTYKGGLTVLIYDKNKGDYTKSYTYRALNFRVGKTARKVFQPAVFDTTVCYQPERKFLPMTGGKQIKLFKPSKAFGKNHFCYRAFRDNTSGLIYVARRDTLNADVYSVIDPNSDGGLTIIDTKKTADPGDDEVEVLDTSTTPALAGSDVYDIRMDPNSGKLFVGTGNLLSAARDELCGLAVIDKDDKVETYRSDGKFDTTNDRTGKLIDRQSALHSGFVLGTLEFKNTGDILVLQTSGIDIIHEGGFVSRIPCEIFVDLPGKPKRDVLWASHGWLDDKDRLYLCTGELGGLGLLVLEMVKYEAEG